MSQPIHPREGQKKVSTTMEDVLFAVAEALEEETKFGEERREKFMEALKEKLNGKG